MLMWVARRYLAVNVNGHPNVALNPTMLSLDLLIFASLYIGQIRFVKRKFLGNNIKKINSLYRWLQLVFRIEGEKLAWIYVA